LLNLPNSITLLRLVSIPIFLALLSSELYLAALAVFVLGGLTDAVDGAVARLTRQQTSLGAHLDPVADKLLVMSSFVMLGLADALPPWLVALVVSRDIIILVGFVAVSLLTSERPELRPTRISKVNTVAQLVTIGVVLAALGAPRRFPPAIIDALIGATALLTVLSGLQYLYVGLVWLQKRAPFQGR
jgi:cardiolipin synthase